MSGQVDPNGQSTPKIKVDENTDFSQFSDEQLVEISAQFADSPASVVNPESTPEPEKAENLGEGQPVELDGKEEEPAPAGDPSMEPPKPDELVFTQSREQLEKSYRNLQQAYGRMSNEIGELRKRIPAEPTQEEFDNDSVAATKKLNQRTQMTAEAEEKERQAMVIERQANNIAFHKQFTPDLNANSEGIRSFLIENQGMTSEQASNYMGNIMSLDPAGVYMLNERYKAEVTIRNLKAEVERLKKAPSEAVKKMTQINRQASVVDGSTGESSDPAIGIVSDPIILAGLSDEELKKQFLYAQKQEYK